MGLLLALLFALVSPLGGDAPGGLPVGHHVVAPGTVQTDDVIGTSSGGDAIGTNSGGSAHTDDAIGTNSGG